MCRGLLSLMGLFIAPLFFIISCSYLSQSLVFSVILSSFFLISIYILNKNEYAKISPFSLLIHFDCLFSIPMLFILFTLDIPERIKKYCSIYCIVYVFISIFNFKYKLLFIYFWGIPQVVLISYIIYTTLKRIHSYRKIIKCAICTILIFYIFSMTSDYNGVHIAFKGNARSPVITENSLKNSSPYNTFSIVYGFNKDSCIKENDLFSIFLPEHESNIENIIRTDENIKGTFYLYGEHDNYNNYIYSGSRFKNDHTQQSTPWAYNRPYFDRNLLIASYKDPFYCSNIGATIHRFPQLIPYVWKYNSFGIPVILIAKEHFKDKSIFYIGDSDPFVPFLAPYNKNFLHSLYGNNNFIDIIRVLAFIIFIFATRNIAIYCISIVLLLICFLPNKYEQNIFDMSVSFINIDILSPHTENDPSSLIKNIYKLGYTVSTQFSKSSKCDIFVIKNTGHIDIDKNKKNIIFLLEGSSVYIDGQKYQSGDIPLGTAIYNDIPIPDARIVDGLHPILYNGNIIIIGTNSPQRFSAYEEILK